MIDVFMYGCGLLPCNQALVEPRGIQFEGARILFQLCQLEFLLVLEEYVVEIPELALLVCAASGFRGLLRVGVHWQREVLEGYGHLACELLLEFFEIRMNPLAIRALVICELDDHNRCVLGAAPWSVVERR